MSRYCHFKHLRSEFGYRKAGKNARTNSFYIFRQQNLLHRKTCCIISLLFAQNIDLFHYVILFCSINTHGVSKACTKVYISTPVRQGILKMAPPATTRVFWWYVMCTGDAQRHKLIQRCVIKSEDRQSRVLPSLMIQSHLPYKTSRHAQSTRTEHSLHVSTQN
jgi:hypothetical protein